MPENFQRQTYIYRISHYENLESTLRNGIYCRNSSSCDPDYINIGHRNLIEKRGQRIVPLSPGGVLNDYIPFYFAPRSPKLFSIHNGSVQGCNYGQNEIIYIVSSIETIKKANIRFVFTDGHAYQNISKFFNDERDLNQVDQSIMGAKYWNNTDQDNDRMRRRMAEFLIYEFVPVNCILAIIVYNDEIKNKVDSIQQNCQTQINVSIKKTWYF